ncbi:MAG TPA: enoyl-CoA hydratase-related protein [bacterium]|nr:enoyl-CoA hydratase-related protein [bacterium]
MARLFLNRPQSRNALSKELAAQITQAFEEEATRAETRVLVLGGLGSDFCAGADLGEMRASGEADHAQNVADAQRLAAMFHAVHSFPRPVLARVQGGVFGGGAGLVAACDVAVVANGAQFAFSEVRLGILPAIISPYVMRKIGEANARRYFLTGERFGAEEALAMGLAAKICPAAELDAAVEEILAFLLLGSPDAQRRIKELLNVIAGTSIEEANRRTPDFIAGARASEEGREGLRAFLEKRKPRWVQANEEST